jgi:PPM family protein phosphatase
MTAHRVEIACRTRRGTERRENQDAIRIVRWTGADGSTAGFALVLADGMGGGTDGAEASRRAVGSICTSLEALAHLKDLGSETWQETVGEKLRAVVAKANMAVRAIAGPPADAGVGATVGTTVAILLFINDWYATVHVGDSRIYRLRNHVLRQLTIDHTWLQDRRQAGMGDQHDALAPHAGFLTRALGLADQVEPVIEWGQPADGDRFLLCSDGMSRYADGAALGLLLRLAGRPRRAAGALLQHALARGAEDDVTVGVVRWDGWAGLRLPPPAATTDPVVLREEPPPEPRDHLIDTAIVGAALRSRARLRALTAGLAACLVVTVLGLLWLVRSFTLWDVGFEQLVF